MRVHSGIQKFSHMRENLEFDSDQKTATGNDCIGCFIFHYQNLWMSALPPKADIGTQPRDVCFVAKADTGLDSTVLPSVI
jgi:hypothetical protein